jgi:hypothetical protein
MNNATRPLTRPLPPASAVSHWPWSVPRGGWAHLSRAVRPQRLRSAMPARHCSANRPLQTRTVSRCRLLARAVRALERPRAACRITWACTNSNLPLRWHALTRTPSWPWLMWPGWGCLARAADGSVVEPPSTFHANRGSINGGVDRSETAAYPCMQPATAVGAASLGTTLWRTAGDEAARA